MEIFYILSALVTIVTGTLVMYDRFQKRTKK